MSGSLTGLRFLGVLIVATATLGLAPADDERLIQAVRNQDGDLARQLVAEGVDVNATQGDGATALHWAAHREDVPTARLLLEAGAQVNVTNDLGSTPLQVACENRYGPMVELLLGAGADPNATLLNGETVLMTCARSGDLRAGAPGPRCPCACAGVGSPPNGPHVGSGPGTCGGRRATARGGR